MKTVKLNYKVVGAKQTAKAINDVSAAADKLRAALAKLKKAGIDVQYKVTRAK